MSRGVANSRSKDFYDLFIIYKLKWNEIDLSNLKNAFKNTCNNRNTVFSFDKALSCIDLIENDLTMLKRWDSFSKKKSFASNISFLDTICVLKEIIKIIFN